MEHRGPIPGSEHSPSFPSVGGSSPMPILCCGGRGHAPPPGPSPCYPDGPRDGTWQLAHCANKGPFQERELLHVEESVLQGVR